MMLRRIIALSSLFILGCASDDPDILRGAARKGVFLPTLSSHEAALEYARNLNPRGRVDRVRIGWSTFMVVFQHGSGIPVTKIAVYQREGFRWRLVSEPIPPFSDHMSAVAKKGKIVVVGSRTNQTSVLYDPNARTG